MGLKDSRWASAPTTGSLRTWPQNAQPLSSSTPAATRPAPASTSRAIKTSPERELDRYLKLVARLKWKLSFLFQGYSLATDRVGRSTDEVAADEMHFKIDFYEYYMHIERALVHLMGVFGIEITGLADSTHNSSGRSHSHRFHANVLAALERPDNPLREALGQGGVMKQLSRAKQLRNRWKNADGDSGPDEKGYTPAPLEAYNLEQILQTIFAGCDQAYAIAESHIQQLRDDSGPDNPMDWEREEEDWGFIADAMDWEAV
ncbi:hypothetical protein PFICI_10996 [Pestalotiopsis fici W106-1]|uniref:Uncharacterized protein n=1 Tax=Pestalotiopsis fici (strain W106-1 / CGMCC3.15140) TaxID=1229662 RepID=W3WVF4_PESFW|nr:uncharacterized protein PFICI_10996 [Pestalotiopsis fici W106-1]ETS77122.1 hypothetical protein PFICI_10996 [Pestalotiopsis fici W106-1]